jgi:regulator of replication initiation timing
MTSFDSSRVISAFDRLVEHMQSIELPPFDTFHASDTVLPVFKTLLQQYADQHSRTKKDIASLRSAWTCIASVAPYIPPQAVLESSDSAMLPPASSLPGAALDAVSDVASGYSELENSRQLVRQLQQQLQDLTTQYETQKEDVCTENERLRLQISELEARLLAPPPNPSSSSVAIGDGGAQQQVQNNQPTLAQFARATSNAAQRKDEAFMRQVFNRHATNEKLSASTLIAALNDVAAPLLAATSSESSSDSADFVFRRADANMSGDIDFSE